MPEPIKGIIAYELKTVTVEQAYLRGNPDRIKVWVCEVCGSVVFDPPRHDAWHRS